MTTPRDAIAGHPSLIDEIRYLASPDAERMSDFQRINRFVTVGCEAATALDALQARVKELERESDGYKRLYNDEVVERLRAEKQRDAAEARATSAEQQRDEALERLSIAANYFNRYCQDEAAEPELCVSEQHHEDAKAFEEAIRRLGRD